MWVWLLVAPLFMPANGLIKVAVYNPLSLVAAQRSWDISDAVPGLDVVILPGTRWRAPSAAAVTVFNSAAHRFHSFGYGVGPFTNRSAGIALAIRKSFAPQTVVVGRLPPRSIQGRGGMLRVRRGAYDVSILGAYVPPFHGTG